MNREASMRRYLKVLPLLGALLAACSSPSPVDEIVASNLAARGGKETAPGAAVDPGDRDGDRERRTGRAGGPRDQAARPVPARVLVRGNDERLRERRQDAAGRSRRCRGSSSPRRCRRKPTRRRGSTSATSKARSSTGARRGTSSSSSAVRRSPAARPSSSRWRSRAVRSATTTSTSRRTRSSAPTSRGSIKGRPTQLENTFSDFREVGGLVFPHLIETQRQGPAPGPQDRRREDRARPRARRRAVPASPVAPRPHRSCRLVRHLVRHSDTSV